MIVKSNLLSGVERAELQLRALYRSCGYTKYKMSKFEEYDLYAENKSFLLSDSIITFTGTGGRLMALKPDVTLSIVKSTKDGRELNKVFYCENVYRPKDGDRDFCEIMQTGIECIGSIGDYELGEVLLLAAKSLETVSPDFVLDISHLGIVSEAIERLSLSASERSEILSAIAEKNLHSALAICRSNGVEDEKTALLSALITSCGDPGTVLGELYPLLGEGAGKEAADQLLRIIDLISPELPANRLRIDFSVAGDMSYYGGIVMSGFIRGVSRSVLSGGQYDGLLQKMGRKSGAVGFALYLDLLEELEDKNEDFDVDTLILYDETTPLESLFHLRKKLTEEGKFISAQKEKPERLRYREITDLRKGGADRK